jgi:hypothetical protein
MCTQRYNIYAFDSPILATYIKQSTLALYLMNFLFSFFRFVFLHHPCLSGLGYVATLHGFASNTTAFQYLKRK